MQVASAEDLILMKTLAGDRGMIRIMAGIDSCQGRTYRLGVLFATWRSELGEAVGQDLAARVRNFAEIAGKQLMRICSCVYAALAVWTGSVSLLGFTPFTTFADPPTTPVRPVTDTYHGVKVVDPYRWLETDKDSEVKSWSAAENAYARQFLDRLPDVAAIRARVTAIMSARVAEL